MYRIVHDIFYMRFRWDKKLYIRLYFYISLSYGTEKLDKVFHHLLFSVPLHTAYEEAKCLNQNFLKSIKSLKSNVISIKQSIYTRAELCFLVES